MVVRASLDCGSGKGELNCQGYLVMKNTTNQINSITDGLGSERVIFLFI